LKRSWIRKVYPTNKGARGPLMRKEEKEVVTEITNIPIGIPKGGHTTIQVHLLPESIRDMKWMN
jgi:hypothetical protein